MAISDTRIRNAKAKPKPYRLGAGGGLWLEVRPNGAKLWRFRYRLDGKENMFALGAYPEVLLAKAREKRDAARRLVKAGLNPAQQQKLDNIRKAHENATTFEAVAREWLAENKGHWTARTHRQRERVLEEDVFPDIGSLPLRQVTPANAHAILKKIEKRAPHMAVIARQTLSGVSQLGIATLRADVDITSALRRAVRTPPTKHKATLRVHEIKPFFEALERYPGSFAVKTGIRLLWWTLARPIEVIGAKWSEFDLVNGIWTIPAHRMKMRQPHAIPLPTQAVAALELSKQISPASEYVVPSRTRPRKPATPTVFAKAFVSMGYEAKFSPHGVRATGRTLLGEQGHPRDVLERQLAHREKKEVRAYDQGDRLETRRTLMQAWADYLYSICSGTNVTNIRAAKQIAQSKG